MCKYLERRKGKARLLVDQVCLTGAHEHGGMTFVSGIVPSSGGGSYYTSIVVKDGHLWRRACECPDDGSLIGGRRFCKHAIALWYRWWRDTTFLALVMHLTGWEWVMEFGGGAWVHESH